MVMVARAFPEPWEILELPRLGSGELLFYAAVAAGEGNRERLAARLLAALAERAPAWAGAPDWGGLTLEADPLGRPRLRLGGKTGPSLSFSAAGGLIWGAMAGRGEVGVDAAREQDFTPPYPYSRAFGQKEWDWAWRHCQGRKARAAALLWAAKEAVVKALGVGFHSLDPLDLEVAPLGPASEGLNLLVQTPGAVSAWARPLADGWLALAAA